MKVKTVLVAINGMVACIDEKGEQIPECQGFILDVADKLKELCDQYTIWQWGVQKGDVSWWWRER